MKKLFPLMLVFLTVSVFGQTSDLATGTRAKNGKLISLTNIVGLSDCETKNFVGKVRKIRVDLNAAHFQLSANKEREKIEVDLKRIAGADRAVLFDDMIRRNYTLRVVGYSCNLSPVISAFSIDLVSWSIGL